MKTNHPFGLRMPPELKSVVAASAMENNRSMNAEIIHQLKRAYSTENEKAGSPLTA